MNKETLNIFKKPNDKKINSQTIFYSKLKSKKENSKQTIYNKIDDLLKSPKFIYKIKVEIELNDRKIVRDIIGRNKQYLMTVNNDNILISKIKDIKYKE